MRPFSGALFAKGKPPPAKLLGVWQNPTATLTALGIRAGDIMFVTQQVDGYNQGTPPTSGSSQAWTFLNNGGQGGSNYVKGTLASDLGAKVNGRGDFYLIVYRGARDFGFPQASSVTKTNTSVTISGIKKSARHGGLVLSLADVIGSNLTATSPATWTQRAIEQNQANVAIWDRLYPANAVFSNNADIVIASNNNTDNVNFTVVELLL